MILSIVFIRSGLFTWSWMLFEFVLATKDTRESATFLLSTLALTLCFILVLASPPANDTCFFSCGRFQSRGWNNDHLRPLALELLTRRRHRVPFLAFSLLTLPTRCQEVTATAGSDCVDIILIMKGKNVDILTETILQVMPENTCLGLLCTSVEPGSSRFIVG